MKSFWALLFGASALVACTGLLGLEPISFDEIPDATLEAGTETSVPDASIDAPEDPAAHCIDGVVHDFCDDFEGITRVDQRWTNPELGATGTVTLVERDGGGHASRHQVQTNVTPTVPIARLTVKSNWPTTTDGAQRKVVAAFDMYLDAVDGVHKNMNVWDVVTGTEANGFEDAVAVYLTCGALAESCGLAVLEGYMEDGGIKYGGKSLTSISIPVQKWVSVTVQLNERPAGTPGGGMNVTVDGVSEPFGFATSARTSYFRANFGLSNGTTAGGDYTVLYDNVRLDWLE